MKMDNSYENGTTQYVLHRWYCSNCGADGVVWGRLSGDVWMYVPHGYPHQVIYGRRVEYTECPNECLMVMDEQEV